MLLFFKFFLKIRCLKGKNDKKREVLETLLMHNMCDPLNIKKVHVPKLLQ
jgi:hypothetical protein